VKYVKEGSINKKGLRVTLKEGTSSDCVTGGTPCSVTGAAGASDIFFFELEARGGVSWGGTGFQLSLSNLVVVDEKKNRE